MRVVVVGASGNVGSAVLRRLRVDASTEVVGISRHVPPPGSPSPFDGAWHSVDVSRPGSVRDLTAAFAGADAVVNLAWLLQPNHDERVLAATNIDGLKHVLMAVAAAGVPQVVVASSVGAYSPGPKRRRVDESWPTGGIATSHYSRHKAVVERILDRFEQEHADVAVARLRPGLVMQAGTGEELRALFMGGLVPVRWLGRVRVPVVPLPSRAIAQVVHADDLADAVARIVETRAAGPFNIAAEPVIGPDEVARSVGGRALRVRAAPVRALVALAWRLRLVAADPGWLDIAVSVPVMSTERARAELGWAPTRDSVGALEEVVRAVGARDTTPGSPHLAAPRR